MDNYEQLKQEMTLLCRSRGSTWTPTSEDLANIEQYAFVGILEPKTIATLLHVDYKEFVVETFVHPYVLGAIELGKARALLAVNTTLMGVSTGVIDPTSIDFRALKFLCTSRFGYDENAVNNAHNRKTTKKRERIEREKLKFAREVHSDRIDLETTKMTLGLSTDELNAVTKGDNEL